MPCLELRPERENGEPVVAVVGIEDIKPERHLAAHKLREQAPLDVSIALIDHRALADEAEAQPLQWSEAELAPRVGEAVFPDLQVSHVLGFYIEIGAAV